MQHEQARSREPKEIKTQFDAIVNENSQLKSKLQAKIRVIEDQRKTINAITIAAETNIQNLTSSSKSMTQLQINGLTLVSVDSILSATQMADDLDDLNDSINADLVNGFGDSDDEDPETGNQPGSQMESFPSNIEEVQGTQTVHEYFMDNQEIETDRNENAPIPVVTPKKKYRKYRKSDPKAKEKIIADLALALTNSIDKDVKEVKIPKSAKYNSPGERIKFPCRHCGKFY